MDLVGRGGWNCPIDKTLLLISLSAAGPGQSTVIVSKTTLMPLFLVLGIQTWTCLFCGCCRMTKVWSARMTCRGCVMSLGWTWAGRLWRAWWSSVMWTAMASWTLWSSPTIWPGRRNCPSNPESSTFCSLVTDSWTSVPPNVLFRKHHLKSLFALFLYFLTFVVVIFQFVRFDSGQNPCWCRSSSNEYHILILLICIFDLFFC